jgi:hypothetical protein
MCCWPHAIKRKGDVQQPADRGRCQVAARERQADAGHRDHHEQNRQPHRHPQQGEGERRNVGNQDVVERQGRRHGGGGGNQENPAIARHCGRGAVLTTGWPSWVGQPVRGGEPQASETLMIEKSDN